VHATYYIGRSQREGLIYLDGNAGVEGGEVVGGRWSVVGGRWSVVGGRWSVVGGRWSVVGGRWSVVGGRWSVEYPMNHVSRIKLFNRSDRVAKRRVSLTTDHRPPTTSSAFHRSLPRLSTDHFPHLAAGRRAVIVDASRWRLAWIEPLPFTGVQLSMCFWSSLHFRTECCPATKSLRVPLLCSCWTMERAVIAGKSSW
jgi:hypothetical protein